MGDWFSHSCLSVLVSGNIQVKNCHLFMMVNVIRRFLGPPHCVLTHTIPFWLNRSILHHCKIIYLKYDATTANPKT